jgi:sulfur carrier protein
MMKIKVNGEEREVAQATTLEQLIRSLGLESKVMAAAVNMEIVKQDAWDKAVLNDGDTIELLDFVGGG